MHCRILLGIKLGLMDIPKFQSLKIMIGVHCADSDMHVTMLYSPSHGALAVPAKVGYKPEATPLHTSAKENKGLSVNNKKA